MALLFSPFSPLDCILHPRQLSFSSPDMLQVAVFLPAEEGRRLFQFPALLLKAPLLLMDERSPFH